MNQEQQGKKMGEIIAKAWADEGFKQRLLADANAALKAEGVEVPAGITVKVLENTDKVFNFVLPAKPKSELDDADLARVAGGFWGEPAPGPGGCGGSVSGGGRVLK